MGQIAKFAFETWFEGGPEAERPVRAAPRQEKDPPPPALYTALDLEAARGTGYAEGVAAGEARAQASIEQQAAAAAARLAEALRALGEAGRALEAAGLAELARLATAIARKLVGRLIESEAAAIIESLAAECFGRLFDQPRVIFRLAPPLVERLRAPLAAAAARAGFPGPVEILGDEALGGADARIEWANGLAERSSEEIWREIQATIDHFAEADGERAAASARNHKEDGGDDNVRIR